MMLNHIFTTDAPNIFCRMNNDGKFFAQIRLAVFVVIDDLCKQKELRAREILHHV